MYYVVNKESNLIIYGNVYYYYVFYKMVWLRILLFVWLNVSLFRKCIYYFNLIINGFIVYNCDNIDKSIIYDYKVFFKNSIFINFKLFFRYVVFLEKEWSK